MKTTAELNKRHLMDFETQNCMYCGEHISVIAAKKNPYYSCPGKQFKSHYFTPFVQNIIVKQPSLCKHPDANWAGECVDCGVMV